MQSKKHRVPDAALNIRRARWGRRGVIASLLVGMGTLAAKSFSWLHFSPADGGEYRVIAQWQVSTGGEGLIIAVGPHSSPEKLRDLGKRLQERFHGVDNAAVMIFDDANAARAVRRGSRIVSETDFQAAPHSPASDVPEERSKKREHFHDLQIVSCGWRGNPV